MTTFSRSIAWVLCGVFLSACSEQSSHETAEDQPDDHNYPYQLELAANSWVQEQPQQTLQLISADGIRGWRSSSDVIQVFLHTETAGEIELTIVGKAKATPTLIEVEVAGQHQIVEFTSTETQQLPLGSFDVTEPGYQRILLHGISSPVAEFAELDHLLVRSQAGAIKFIEHDVYWGRRGPSVHLGYQVPENTDIEWFYSEITVPEHYDTIGSFFMANGFADGYFGFQVNSASERRVLFSVWSPYETDDPASIPAEYQVKLQRKGDAVQTGEFGNEGSGGQSFLRHSWQTETAYGFLLQGRPVTDDFTEYNAWFFDPDQGEWQFIASFHRPKTQRFIERPHSFLENFLTETGDQIRKAYYHNQWFKTADGQWLEATSARFTGDATAQSKNRLDFAGGSSGQQFYLQNTGFFSPHTELNTTHERLSTTFPESRLAQLP